MAERKMELHSTFDLPRHIGETMASVKHVAQVVHSDAMGRSTQLR